jgi:hypothetical protein
MFVVAVENRKKILLAADDDLLAGVVKKQTNKNSFPPRPRICKFFLFLFFLSFTTRVKGKYVMV